MVKVSIGQDSHRIEEGSGKPLILGGVDFLQNFGLTGNSDADVVLHAITNAISGITTKPVIGPIADKMCKEGIQDSREYLKVSLADLQLLGYQISHLSLSIECLKPKIIPRMNELRENLSQLLSMQMTDIAITATTGEGLTDFGKGLGIQVFCILTAVKI